MVMGTSTQASPFRPCCAPSFCLRHPFRRSSSFCVAISSPEKTLGRQEIQSFRDPAESSSAINDSGFWKPTPLRWFPLVYSWSLLEEVKMRSLNAWVDESNKLKALKLTEQANISIPSKSLYNQKLDAVNVRKEHLKASGKETLQRELCILESSSASFSSDENGTKVEVDSDSCSNQPEVDFHVINKEKGHVSHATASNIFYDDRTDNYNAHLLNKSEPSSFEFVEMHHPSNSILLLETLSKTTGFTEESSKCETAVHKSAKKQLGSDPSKGETAVRKSAKKQLGSVPSKGETAVPKSAKKQLGSDPSKGETAVPNSAQKQLGSDLIDLRKNLISIYEDVLVVDNIAMAKRVVAKLTNEYRHLIHACDTEVSKIDLKQETPVGHGEVICFSIYSGPEANFDEKSCVWVDVLDGEKNLLMEFAPFFGDASIGKVWHNYSFDCHVLENCGLKVAGLHADTIHLARLWDSSRRAEGGYSLEALTSDPRVISFNEKSSQKAMSGASPCAGVDLFFGKISMKSIFGKKKLKKDGSEGKVITFAPVDELQREDREAWICYSALDSIHTFRLYESLRLKLMKMPWLLDGDHKGNMYDFYNTYWRPFGEILVKMESEGMLVDRAYLAEVEKVAIEEQKLAVDRFKKWASRYCADAMYMNVGSDVQLRQLFFGGIMNRKNPNEFLPEERNFNVPNFDKVIEQGKKVPLKNRSIKLHKISEIQTEMYTPSGWPSVSGDALKIIAGKVSADMYKFQSNDSFGTISGLPSEGVDEEINSASKVDEVDISVYGTAYNAFGGNGEGKEACHAIASLCEVCSIDSLISNFILPLQGNHISGKNGRIHCSLNINTETGRLSARRPNLQNQPALEKDRYKIRQAFIAEPGNTLIVADYGQLELRILAHLANCKSMLDAFSAGGDFHSRTAMNMYPHIQEAVEAKQVLLEWYPQPGEEKPPVPLLKDAFASERRKAKMLNFSIAYGKTPVGLARDWKVDVMEAKKTVDLWYKERQEVLGWQEERKKEAHEECCVYTLLGRRRRFPALRNASYSLKNHIERAAINTPVQGSAADVAMCAMLEISRNSRLNELGWRLLLQVHDEVILEGPTESAEAAKAIVVDCMSKPFNGTNFLKVELSVDAKCAQNWYAAK